jgi:hypothetical protein
MTDQQKTVTVLFLTLLTASLAPLLNAQVRSGLITPVYDNFNSQWLDPNKWETTANCWNGLPLECVREIQNGQLRLAIRAMGSQNSDFGDQQTASFLQFANPGAVKSITATVTVRSANGALCPSNSFVGTAKATIHGAFFNTGSGSYLDDVQAALVLSSYNSLGSSTLDVGGWIGDGNGVNIWTHMGNYPKGTPIFATVSWDQSNHQFIFTVRPDGGAVNQVAVPYNLPDSLPPASPWKQLEAAADPPNCSSIPAFSNIEVLFDNVIVK